MAGSFTVGALAIAADRANAIGAVRLTLAPEALEVELLRVGSFAQSFVPGALVEMVRFRAPYLSIRGLFEHNGALCLSFDPTVVAPFNRFTLSRFTDAPLEALVGAHRARVRARVLSALLPVPVGVAAATMLPESLASGALGRLALGALVGLALHYTLEQLSRWVTFGGPISRHYRDGFERRLAEKLAILPAESPDLVDETPVETSVPIVRGRSEGLLSHPGLRWAAALLAVVLFVVSSLASIKELASPERFPEPTEPVLALESKFQTRAQAAVAAVASAVPHHPRCVCERADSPLWRGGLPMLSMLPSSRQRDESGRPRSDVAPEADAKGVYRYDFDIAVVNNSGHDLNDIKIVLTFARRSEAGERTGVTDRGLFWEGALGPGRAVKWQVEAPGTEVRIDGPELGMLDDVAPADRFLKLTRAQHRVVRLHGAMMLAYLGDPRARDAAMALDGLSATEEQIRRDIVRATAPLWVCGGETEEAGEYSVCVFNATSTPATGVMVEEVEGESTGRRVEVEGQVPVHEGVRVPFPLAGREPPVELVAEAR